MNAKEAVLLCRLAKAACPQQAIDEYTPDVWLDLLGDLRFADAKDALLVVAQTQPFVAPAEIRDEVRRIRTKRLAEAGDPTPPPDMTPLQTIGWLKGWKRRVGDGEVIDPNEGYGVLEQRNLGDLRQLMPRVDVPTPPSTPDDQEAEAS